LQHQQSRTSFMGKERIHFSNFCRRKSKIKEDHELKKELEKMLEGLGEMPRPCLPCELRGGAGGHGAMVRAAGGDRGGEESRGHHTRIGPVVEQ
jgi:hypothetical protein